MRWFIVGLVILSVIPRSSACWGGVEEDEITKQRRLKIKLNPSKKFNISDPNLWNDWPPPEGVDDFNQFMDKLAKAQFAAAHAHGDIHSSDLGEDEEEEIKDTKNKPADADDSWPENWNGIGIGLFGVPPPPWSYVPKNTGNKPSFCFQPPRRGNCSEALPRFAYNPYVDDCVEFVFSGCYGNQNNFATKEKCLERCLTTSEVGCNPDSRISVGEFKGGRRCDYEQ